MRKIEVSEEVFSGLQQLARPLIDTPNDVIRRLLESTEVDMENPALSHNHEEGYDLTLLTDGNGRVPQSTCKEKLLKVLFREYGGQGMKRDVTKAVVRALMQEGIVSKADFGRVRSGEIKIENRIAFARNELKEEGLLEFPDEVGHGVWKLTKKGMEAGAKL